MSGNNIQQTSPQPEAAADPAETPSPSMQLSNRPPVTPEGNTPSVSILGAALISAAVSLTLLVSGLAVYDRFFKGHQRTLATVDLEGLVSARELVLIEALSRPGISPDDRNRTLEDLKGFGSQMEAAVAQASADCKCDILVRGAMVGRGSVDLTEDIAARLGISPQVVAQGRERIQRSLASASTLPGTADGADVNTNSVQQPSGAVSNAPEATR